MLVYNAKKVCIVYTKGMEDRVSLHRYKGMYTKGMEDRVSLHRYKGM